MFHQRLPAPQILPTDRHWARCIVLCISINIAACHTSSPHQTGRVWLTAGSARPGPWVWQCWAVEQCRRGMKYDDQCLCQKLHSHSMLHSLIHRQLEARLSAARRSADQNTVYTIHSRLLLPAFIHTQHIHRQTHRTLTQTDIARHTGHSDTDADRHSTTAHTHRQT